MRERSGLIVLNRLTVRRGVRATVEAQLWAPAVDGAGIVVSGRIEVAAGVRVTSWKASNDPALTCRQTGASETCTQGEEACPVPAGTWHFRLVKLEGPAGSIQFDYVVGPPAET